MQFVYQVEILNANWCLNGQYIFVSSKKRVKLPNFNDDLEIKIQLFTIDHEKIIIIIAIIMLNFWDEKIGF